MILREIWNQSSQCGQPFLTKEEFLIYMKYLSLAQSGYSTTFESFKINHLKISLPVFTGIQIPSPPEDQRRSTNPFDEEWEVESPELGFDDF